MEKIFIFESETNTGDGHLCPKLLFPGALKYPIDHSIRTCVLLQHRWVGLLSATKFYEPECALCFDPVIKERACATSAQRLVPPQGSFTNHFRSKEAFTEEVLDQYFDYLKGLVSQALTDETRTPRQRLKRYLDIITDKLECDRWRIGCLIGDLSLEASSQSKRLRQRLDAIFQEWRSLFASCIAAAQSAGEVDSKFDATELAEFLSASWEGAILRMKVEQGPAALERFKTIVFATVFKVPGSFELGTRHRAAGIARRHSKQSARARSPGNRHRQAIGKKP